MHAQETVPQSKEKRGSFGDNFSSSQLPLPTQAHRHSGVLGIALRTGIFRLRMEIYSYSGVPADSIRNAGEDSNPFHGLLATAWVPD